MSSFEKLFENGDESQLRASLSSIFPKKDDDCVDDSSFQQGSPINGVKCLPELVSIPASLLGNAKNEEDEKKAEPHIYDIDKIDEKPQMPPKILDEKYKVKESRNGQTKNGRHFLLTLNQDWRWEELKKYIINLKSYHWGIACRETAPTTGHIHVHFYVQFKNPLKLSIKKLCGARADKCNAKPIECIEYVKKEKDPEKRGTIIFEEDKTEPWGMEEKIEGEKGEELKYEDALLMDNEELGKLPFSQMKNIEELIRRNDAKLTGAKLHKKVKVLYLYGKSGVGKSIYAKWLFRNEVFDTLKCKDGFWSGTSSYEVKCALYDDFRDMHMEPSEFINFIDSDIHNMNIKYGNYQNRYKYIIITSIQPPAQLYANFQKKNEEKGLEEPNWQWMRRMKAINMEQWYKDHPGKLDIFLKDLGYLDENEEEDPDDPFKEIDFDI